MGGVVGVGLAMPRSELLLEKWRRSRCGVRVDLDGVRRRALGLRRSVLDNERWAGGGGDGAALFCSRLISGSGGPTAALSEDGNGQ